MTLDPETTQPGPDRNLYCLQCGYNLRGLTGDPCRCPECFFSNPIEVLEIPADEITRQLTILESAPTMCLANLLLLIGSLAMLLSSRMEAWPCMVISFIAALFFIPLSIRSFAKSCQYHHGWVWALLKFQWYGGGMIVIIVGAAPLLTWWLTTWWNSPLTLFIFLPVWIIPSIYLARWARRKAKEDMEPLQRTAAVSIAKDLIRRKMASPY
ncbi:MAG: hypothetical protein HJJLKODD_02747 [Phycisphaerae bacterium]|nr:hypothetical protein [Phycisphaerae bacterium]